MALKNRLKKGKCLIEECPARDKIFARGLCVNHYQIIQILVKAGKRTWEEFEKYGMALPSKRGKFLSSLEKMLAKKKRK